MSFTFLLISIVLVPALTSPDSQWIPRFVGTNDEVDNDSFLNTDDFNNTKLVLSFVVFRHGDRTPDQQELDKYPSGNFNNSIFHPYGKKALTNRGKQRAFLTGKYLRERYNNTISELYLPNEISVRTTDYARTKMTALTVLAAMYPPPLAQKWNHELDWQPIPYDTMPAMDDDLLHFANCPQYQLLKERVYEIPEVRDVINSSEGLFEYLREETGGEIIIPENVFFLDNLFQTLNNTGVILPQWVQDTMPQIKEITNLEYSCFFYDNELIRLATGVLMKEILDAMKAAIDGNEEQAKLRLYSGHENNVAALLAATRVFKPHQPKYGSTVSLELRKDLETGNYGVTVVYAAEAGGPGVILPIEACGAKPICDYDTFVMLTKDVLMERNEYKEECSPLS